MSKAADIMDAFYRYHFFSKADLLEAMKTSMEFIENTNKTEMAKYHKMELYKKFIEKLEKCRLPELVPENWEYYEYEIFGDAIELSLCSTDSDIQLSEDGTEIDSMSSTVESILLRVDSDYVSIDQFAKIQDVTPLTVQRWIHKGKLRFAKLDDNGEWLIPSTQDKPSQSYDYVDWTLLEPLRIDEFPLVSASEEISIYQDYDNKSVFKCSFRHFQNKFWMNMNLTRNDVEELEYALIVSGKARPSAPGCYVPMPNREKQ